ncbi:MAG TPA: ATP-binding protein [Usitatibacter sp.]|nr:ATP-binding protein [Usitatibacter sp.]
MTERRSSLRGRLLALLLAGTGAVWAIVAVGTFLDARQHSERLFDAQLTEYSEVLGAVAGHEFHEMAGETTVLEHEYGQECTYQVFSLSGELLMRSHAAPSTALASENGFSDVSGPTGRWRAFRRVDAANALVIVVAHRMDEREALVRGFALRLLLPFALGLPLVGLVLWLAVSRALRPLEQLAGEVRGREADRLSPIAAGQAPREVEPLIAALNQLFGRLARSFENERRFTGDAAHELRTPLAALKTHAEVALTTASDERRRRSLQQVVDGVDRASRLVEQLLALARLDAAQSGYEETVDIARLAREALEPMQPEASRRGVWLRVKAPVEGVRVPGEGSMLQALVRNLAENAVRHAPVKGVVRVGVHEDAGMAVVEVEDSGPGVPPELRERIFDRHFRAPGDSGGAAGLGLSIARRVVELHGGTISATSSAALGGLKVQARIPLARKETLSIGPQSDTVEPPQENVS